MPPPTPTNAAMQKITVAEVRQQLSEAYLQVCVKDAEPQSSAEDEEYQGLEVIFDPGISSKHRRKSSLAYTSSQSPPRIGSSSCFVHALLEAQKAAEAGKTIAEFDSQLHKNEELGAGPSMDSRMLTKMQLTDLALGVRELSKRFASMELRLKVRNFFLVTKPHDNSLLRYTRELALWLLEHSQDSVVYVDRNIRESKEFDAMSILSEPSFENRLRYWTPEMCLKHPHTFDFVITLGGDGTVLYASWLFQKIVPPVLSFALGSLGFLTTFDFKDFPRTIEHCLNDGITVGLRLRFEGTIMRSLKRERGQSIEGCDMTRELLGMEADGPTHRGAESFTILNEVVVDRGPNSTMSSTELFGDDEHLTSILADGICISTPTGSTAYSLAAGGSLCHPEIPSMLVSPICAHSLTFRPLILPDSMVLRVGVPYDARTSAWASFDGRQRVELRQGDYITVSASRFPFPTIQSRKQNKDWFGSLSRNFHWGVRQKQKPYNE